MAGTLAERQENALVKMINDAVKKNGVDIKVKAGKVTVNNVVKAEKFGGRQVSGSEPYIDVNLVLKNGKTVGLSMKGESAPSLAGGGLKGINLAVPGLADRFMKAVFTHLMKKIQPGDKVPDVYGKISIPYKEKIVVGNKNMGGPIDYMYIGSMNPASSYDKNKNCLEFRNGALFEAKEYARSHDLYFRLRARREDQVFDPEAKDNKNVPKIYSKSPSRGDSAGRIVVTDKVPTNARTSGNIVIAK
jgi:hypothetical protein